jgi:hypothetical protein
MTNLQTKFLKTVLFVISHGFWGSGIWGQLGGWFWWVSDEATVQ